MRYRLRIKKSYLLVIILLLSFFHATLRSNPDSFLSAFRLTIPFIYIFLYLRNMGLFVKETKLLLFVFLYNLATSLLFYQRLDYFLEFYLHILCIFSLYIVLVILRRKERSFTDVIYHLLDKVTVITIALFFLQYAFRFEFPNTVPGRLCLYYWTENELGMSLAFMVPFYAMNLKNRSKLANYLKIAGILVILFINDNKLSMIGVALAFMAQLFVREIKKIKNKRLYLSVILAAIFIIIALVLLWNPTIRFVGYSIKIDELLLEPIERILFLKPYRLAGSIYDRTDAVIYGLMELKRSFFLGIGLGNSIEMLKLPQYYLATAKSMHNFVAQMVVEMGFSGIIFICYIMIKVMKGILSSHMEKIDLLRFTYLLCFPIISMQSSSGIFSNYFVWTLTCYLYLYDESKHKYFKKEPGNEYNKKDNRIQQSAIQENVLYKKKDHRGANGLFKS